MTSSIKKCCSNQQQPAEGSKPEVMDRVCERRNKLHYENTTCFLCDVSSSKTSGPLRSTLRVQARPKGERTPRLLLLLAEGAAPPETVGMLCT